jgi:hypothetical protein
MGVSEFDRNVRLTTRLHLPFLEQRRVHPAPSHRTICYFSQPAVADFEVESVFHK